MNKMYLRHGFAFFLCLLFSFSLQAQIPKLISYQGLLADDGGVALTDGDYSITVNLYDAAQGGAPLWSETRTVTLAGGIFNVLLGEITPLDLPFDKMYYLATSIGGIELSPRTAMAASPYALNSAGGGGKAYALDSEDGSKLDVVYVNAAGEVDIKGEVSVLNTEAPADRIYFGIKGEAVEGDRGTGGLFFGSQFGGIGSVYSTNTQDKIGLYGDASGTGTGANIGVSGLASGKESSATGVQGTGNGDSKTPAYGVKGIGQQGKDFNVGIFGEVQHSSIGQNYAIYGKAERRSNSYAGYFDGYLKVGSFAKGLLVEDQVVTIFNDLSSSGSHNEPTLVFTRSNTPPSITGERDDFLFSAGGRRFNFRDTEGFIINSIPDPFYDDPEILSSYGLQLASSNHGLAITLDDNTSSDNSFISFFDDDGMQGRIVGVTDLPNLKTSFNSTIAGFIDELFALPNVGRTDGTTSVFDGGDWSSKENSVDSGTELNNTEEGQFGEVLLRFTGERITAEFLVELVNMSISCVKDFITFATSVFSIADPEDVFSKAFDSVTNAANLGIFLGFVLTSNGVAYESGAGDYAEWLLRVDSNEVITAGDIVGVRAGEISKSFTEADHYMAISTAPAVIGNMPQPEFKHLYEKVAFMGQIPVKVRGVVKKGDYIVPSGEGDGLGIAVNPKEMLARDYHRIVGIAWEESDGKEFFKYVNTAVGINQNDLADIVDQMQTIMNNMQIALKEVNPNYELDLFATQGKKQVTPTNLDLGYTVSATHNSKISGLFTGKQFETHEEMTAAVKQALIEVADIDIKDYESLNFILDNPDKTTEIVQHYSKKLNDLQAFAKTINTRVKGD